MEEKDNDLAKQMMLEEVITKAVQIPGVKVNRRQFLAEQFASMMPMANRLNDTLDKATFNYSDEEFNKDIEIITNLDDYEEVKGEKTNTCEEGSKGINNTTARISKFISKIGKKNGNDPYEEMKKLKELLDNNIITQEEFEQKKKQLLDL